MQTEHLEVVFTPADPVTITLAGGGPPQRGDYFYVDGPIYAVDDVNGTQIGMYHCFGAWTAAADDTDAPYQRLTTVQFLMDDGSIMGLINELGTEQASLVGAVQGGTGRYTGALGTFQQLPRKTQQPERWRRPAPARQGPGRTWCGRSSTSCCRRAARRGPMRTPVPAELSRRLALKLGVAVAGGLAAGSPLTRREPPPRRRS